MLTVPNVNIVVGSASGDCVGSDLVKLQDLKLSSTPNNARNLEMFLEFVNLSHFHFGNMGQESGL